MEAMHLSDPTSHEEDPASHEEDPASHEEDPASHEEDEKVNVRITWQDFDGSCYCLGHQNINPHTTTIAEVLHAACANGFLNFTDSKRQKLKESLCEMASLGIDEWCPDFGRKKTAAFFLPRSAVLQDYLEKGKYGNYEFLVVPASRGLPFRPPVLHPEFVRLHKMKETKLQIKLFGENYETLFQGTVEAWKTGAEILLELGFDPEISCIQRYIFAKEKKFDPYLPIGHYFGVKHDNEAHIVPEASCAGAGFEEPLHCKFIHRASKCLEEPPSTYIPYFGTNPYRPGQALREKQDQPIEDEERATRIQAARVFSLLKSMLTSPCGQILCIGDGQGIESTSSEDLLELQKVLRGLADTVSLIRYDREEPSTDSSSSYETDTDEESDSDDNESEGNDEDSLG
jgi:hypothetical protein